MDPKLRVSTCSLKNAICLLSLLQEYDDMRSHKTNDGINRNLSKIERVLSINLRQTLQLTFIKNRLIVFSSNIDILND
jgi:hypothetical protein